VPCGKDLKAAKISRNRRGLGKRGKVDLQNGREPRERRGEPGAGGCCIRRDVPSLSRREGIRQNLIPL